MSILWTIMIGFIAGVIAKFLMPGNNEPSGFVSTAVLGIVGAFVATYLGHALGWYGPGQGAGLIRAGKNYGWDLRVPRRGSDSLRGVTQASYNRAATRIL
jgi:uncharacterized membrane protein YeaQ/YmgE (transglycosylase-associated protein family)